MLNHIIFLQAHVIADVPKIEKSPSDLKRMADSYFRDSLVSPSKLRKVEDSVS